MATKTVYVEVTSNYSRSTWDDLGSTNYNPGDRVDYFDGSRNRIFVCINSNNSTTEPQNNPTDWAPAGSEEYPFLLIDSTNNLRVTTNSEWTLYGVSSSTVNFLAEELGTWTPDNPIGGNAIYQADGAGGTIILGDGRYTWDYATYAMWWPNNCTIQAKNKQKAYIISSGSYWGGTNVTWKDVVFYNSGTTNVVPGSYSTGYKHNLDSCLSTQETPWGTLTAAKQEPSSSLWTRTLSGTWNGGYIRGCTFDYQYKGPSYLLALTGGSGAVFENNTFYIRVKHSQYSLLYDTGDIILKNNIFYIKYLQDGHSTQGLSRSNALTEGDNVVYLENDSDVEGTIINNLSGGITINPQFISADQSNFSLRPSSPLIGGLKKSSPLETKYPNAIWFDSNSNPAFQTYNFSLDSGDGNNYTFSGDATGADPAISAETGDVLTFVNNTGGHPLEIQDADGNSVATESGGSLTFSTLRLGVYTYICQTHPSMSNTITITANVGLSKNPTNSFASAVDSIRSNDNVIIVKNGTHTLVQSETGGSTTTSTLSLGGTANKLTIIGESTDKAILIANGTSWGVAFNAYGTNISLKLESLTLENHRDSHFGVITGGNNTSVEIESCKLLLASSISTNSNGWFTGNATPDSSLIIKNSIVECAGSPNRGALAGGQSEDNYNVFELASNTFITKTGASTYLIDANVGADLSSFIFKNNIFIGLTGVETIGLTTVMRSSAVLTIKNNCYYNTAIDSSNALDSEGALFDEPKFLDAANGDYRLRPDSPCIGGGVNKDFTEDSVWIKEGSGTGTGTQNDPFYWSQYSDAFLAATQTTSKQVIFKDGTYTWNNSIMQDDNVGNNITMISENIHQAIFTDAGRMTSATKYPTLRFKGIQLAVNDHFTWQQECHYILDSVHVLAGKYMAARSVTASGCIFEVPSGVNSYIFSSTGPAEIVNCIFVDHNDRASVDNYLTGAESGTIKDTIFYTKNPRAHCIASSHNATLINCASENITNPEDGVLFTENLQFVDIDNKNYSLRPNSPLIG